MNRTFPDNPRVLVATKETRLDLYQGKGSPVERLRSIHEESLERLHNSHREHVESLAQVERELTRRGWDYQVQDVGGYDLVLTVGGDGTVLNLSHYISNGTPLIGVNSSPSYSVGYFCACDADELGRTLDAVLAQEVELFSLCRLSVSINGASCGLPALNDILITDANPAATSRYVLQVGDTLEERQRSSGLWISTPAGSTAAIRSAGGSVLPLRSRLIQYLVREPYLPKDKRYHHLSGVQELSQSITLISMMEQGRVFLDGPYHWWNLGVGDKVEIRGDASPLLIYGLREARRFV
jgi:NAD+ kinase